MRPPVVLRFFLSCPLVCFGVFAGPLKAARNQARPLTLHLFFSFLFPAKATFAAITRTYTYLTPDLWQQNHILQDPYSVRLGAGPAAVCGAPRPGTFVLAAHLSTLFCFLPPHCRRTPCSSPSRPCPSARTSPSKPLGLRGAASHGWPRTAGRLL